MAVGLVVVSHSATLARGVAELAGQMAPDVTLVPVGGAADGGLGTDFDAVSTGISRADSGSGVVLLYDLGSAKMVADMAAETADAARVVDAPLVTGAVAAAVAAQGGADLDAVVAAALRGEAAEELGPDAARGEDLLLTNEIGLHARPAALLARTVTELDAQVTISFGDKQVDARSVLGLMALGARGGDTIRLTATGPAAAEALTRIRDLAARNFDE